MHRCRPDVAPEFVWAGCRIRSTWSRSRTHTAPGTPSTWSSRRPRDQVQPKLHSYRLPQARRPDPDRQAAPVRRRSRARRSRSRDDLFPNPWSLGEFRWVGRLVAIHVPLQPARPPGPAARRHRREDRRGEGRSSTSRARRSSTTPEACFVRRPRRDGRDRSGCRERDGWNHLYLYDAQDRRGQEPDHARASGSSAASTASTRKRGRSGSAPAASVPGRTRTTSTTAA